MTDRSGPSPQERDTSGDSRISRWDKLDPVGLADFWQVYERYYSIIAQEMLADLSLHPQLGPLFSSMPKELLDEQSRQGKQQLRDALDGNWGPYEDTLRTQGTTYAVGGMPFSVWYDLVRALQRYLTPRLVDTFLAEPARLSSTLVTIQDFFDAVMTVVAEAYLGAKEDALRQSERAAQDIRTRSLMLEVENVRVLEASRAKSEFLANMSHELRTPLNAIIGFTELVYDGRVTADSPDYPVFLGHVLESANHLLQLINDVLDLSKVEAGKIEFHPEDVQPGVIIREIEAILGNIAATNGVTLTSSIDPNLGHVEADPARLKQVLYNLVSNALKFTNRGGRVSIRASVEADATWRLEVEDTGVGISPEDLPRLFVEFQQLDSGPARQQQGTGLGLALTRRLVEAQGGFVGVQSERGVGSVFHALLPRRAHVGTALPFPRAFDGARAGAPVVLVVEDNAADQQLLVSALLGAGYAVETAATGSLALALCETRQYDAISLDLMLPDRSGLDVLRELRASERYRDVPVLVVTVVADSGAVAGLSVHQLFTKPLDAPSFLDSLRRAGLPAPHPSDTPSDLQRM